MTGRPAPPAPPDLSRLALALAAAIFFACLATMVAVTLGGPRDGLAESLFDTCRTVMISTGAAVVALLGVRTRR